MPPESLCNHLLSAISVVCLTICVWGDRGRERGHSDWAGKQLNLTLSLVLIIQFYVSHCLLILLLLVSWKQTFPFQRMTEIELPVWWPIARETTRAQFVLLTLWVPHFRAGLVSACHWCKIPLWIQCKGDGHCRCKFAANRSTIYNCALFFEDLALYPQSLYKRVCVCMWARSKYSWKRKKVMKNNVAQEKNTVFTSYESLTMQHRQS